MRALLALVLGSAAAACSGARPSGPAAPPPPTTAGVTRADTAALGRGPLVVWSAFDLPDDPRSREISGIAWDDAARALYAVQDQTRDLVVLRPDGALASWAFEPSVPIALEGDLDLEAIVAFPEAFVVASEAGPRLLQLDRAGRFQRELPLPRLFAGVRENKSVESLTRSPSGRFLFTTTEEALTVDGPPATKTRGTRVRVVSMPREGGELAEHAYETDADLGVSELTAVSDDDLLVLERGWAKGVGNTARVYRVSLTDGRSRCLGEPALEASHPVLAKTLVVDLAKLDAPNLPPPKQLQASRVLDNYEGMTVGPRLRDGRPTLILASDDNARPDQFPRILVLTIP